ncbi:uncharacterized protein STEHIDRAFT_165195 [Stereum hirsutum FP-91666 SS1]|uniref:uncharacterized protein n=1 Tax=Stereum hirsutum (strain FP-91666) TaxID=721885 RepID=UPI000440D6B7|nr:uncharacterized protein STEHIDRAFT_165195 [Stereum hirsutum FP-91666 SS1]EIM90635.1 hypothetical protein STEHIDRAFT_165195 [Stereum hirsutum FP-91666 SS1]
MSDSDAPNLCPGWDPTWPQSLKMWMLEASCEAMTYGLFLCLYMLSTHILIRHGLHNSTARIVLISVTTFMLLDSTAHLILTLVHSILQFPYICALSTPPGLTNALPRMITANDLLERAQYLVSDAVVVWRACAIWSGNVAVYVGLGFCFTVTAVTSIFLAVLNVLTAEGHKYTTLEKNMLGTLPLLATNFFATALIAYKAWLYRRQIKQFLRTQRATRPRIQSVLALLVESGFIYLGYWTDGFNFKVLIMIGDFGLYGGYFEFEWFQPNISGIYPTLIILVVSEHKSSSETMFSLARASSCTADGRSIEFGFPQSMAKGSYKESDENEGGTVTSNCVVDYRDEV